MVRRNKERKRKYYGTRRWGVGNIKNARGAGDRGGVGHGGRKHRWTLITAKFPETISKKGFVNWGSSKKYVKEINLGAINTLLSNSKDQFKIELPHHKVLSNGTLSYSAKIYAMAFSKKAIEKIKLASGESIVIGGAKTPTKAAGTEKSAG